MQSSKPNLSGNLNLNLQASRHWRHPRAGLIKFNTDASIVKETGLAFTGILGRNDKGELVGGITKMFPTRSPLMAEALGLQEAMQFAVNLGVSKVVFESDNLQLIKACRKEVKVGEISGVIQDILKIKMEFFQCGFTWVPRQGNEAAHTLAMMARQKILSTNWSWNLPPVLNAVLANDKRLQQVDMRGSREGNGEVPELPFGVVHEAQPPGL